MFAFSAARGSFSDNPSGGKNTQLKIIDQPKLFMQRLKKQHFQFVMKGNFNRENAAGAKKLCENATLTKFQESFHTSCIALLGLLKEPGMYPGTMMLDSLAKSLRK